MIITKKLNGFHLTVFNIIHLYTIVIIKRLKGFGSFWKPPKPRRIRQYNLDVYEHKRGRFTGRHPLCGVCITCRACGYSFDPIGAHGGFLSHASGSHGDGLAMVDRLWGVGNLCAHIGTVRTTRCESNLSAAADCYADSHINPIRHRDSNIIADKHIDADDYTDSFADVDSQWDINFHTDSNSVSDSNGHCFCHPYIDLNPN